jgi:cytochrome bd-type quinol oxidase subunit 1
LFDNFETKIMLTDKERKVLAMYQKQLAIPRWKYIIVYGVLIFGTAILLGIIGVRYFVNKQSLQQQWDNNLWLDFIFMPAAGIAFGWFTRKQAVRNCKLLEEKEKQ